MLDSLFIIVDIIKIWRTLIGDDKLDGILFESKFNRCSNFLKYFFQAVRFWIEFKRVAFNIEEFYKSIDSS